MESEISNLYERSNYLNKNIDLLTNVVIIEYDLHSANTSLCREYRLLPEKEIENLENAPKKKRVVAIGKKMQKDKEFKEKLSDAFTDIRKRFFEANHIIDKDILAIKKDAIFTLREVQTTDFGYCHFAKKNQYSSYMYLPKIRLELYYTSKGETLGDGGKVDVKGIDDTIVKKHDGFMNDFFKNLFKHLETSSKPVIFGYLKRFIDRYKHLQLEVGYYREYDQNSIFRLNDAEETFDDPMFIPYEHRQEHINIDYNFFNILLPIINIII